MSHLGLSTAQSFIFCTLINCDLLHLSWHHKKLTIPYIFLMFYLEKEINNKDRIFSWKNIDCQKVDTYSKSSTINDINECLPSPALCNFISVCKAVGETWSTISIPQPASTGHFSHQTDNLIKQCYILWEKGRLGLKQNFLTVSKTFKHRTTNRRYSK